MPQVLSDAGSAARVDAAALTSPPQADFTLSSHFFSLQRSPSLPKIARMHCFNPEGRRAGSLAPAGFLQTDGKWTELT